MKQALLWYPQCHQPLRLWLNLGHNSDVVEQARVTYGTSVYCTHGLLWMVVSVDVHTASAISSFECTRSVDVITTCEATLNCASEYRIICAWESRAQSARWRENHFLHKQTLVFFVTAIHKQVTNKPSRLLEQNHMRMWNDVSFIEPPHTNWEDPHKPSVQTNVNDHRTRLHRRSS